MGLDRHRCWALEKSTFNRKGWSSRPEVAADPLPGMMTIPFCRHDSIVTQFSTPGCPLFCKATTSNVDQVIQEGPILVKQAAQVKSASPCRLNMLNNSTLLKVTGP